MDAENTQEGSDLLMHFETEAYPAHWRTDTNIEQAFEVVKSQRQIIWAATAELACRSVVQNAAEQLDAGKTLMRPIPDEYQRSIDTKYPAASPTLKRLLSTVYAWFRPAFAEVFQKAKNGEMPHAAIADAGTDIQPVYKWLQHAWLSKSTHPVARAQNALRCRGRLVAIMPSYQAAVVDSLESNVGHAAAFLLGRGVAHGTINPPYTRRELVIQQLGTMADMSSVTRSTSRPILIETGTMLGLYSEWEEGKLSAAEFHALASGLGHSAVGACLHHSLADGRWQRPGHCPADVRFMQLDKFTTPPSVLLKKLGFNSIPKDMSMTHLLLAMTTDVTDRTAFVNWPN